MNYDVAKAIATELLTQDSASGSAALSAHEAEGAGHHVAHALESVPEPEAWIVQTDPERVALILGDQTLFLIGIELDEGEPREGELKEGEPGETTEIVPRTIVQTLPLDHSWVVRLETEPGRVLIDGVGHLTKWTFSRGNESVTVSGQVQVRPEPETGEAEKFARALAGKVGWGVPLAT